MVIVEQVLIFLVLLLLSAFFSGTESAFFSLKRESLDPNDSFDQRIIQLLDNPRRLLITILVGNIVVNIVATALASELILVGLEGMSFPSELVLLIAPVLMTVIILIFGEITPKLICIRHNLMMARSGYPAVVVFVKLLKPVVTTLLVLNGLMQKLLVSLSGVVPIKVTDDEVKAAVKYGELEEEEKSFIRNIVELEHRTASQIMVPRTDIAAFESSRTLTEILDAVRDIELRRYPVYEGNIDHIAGILYVKDLLPFVSNPAGFSIKRLLRPAYFVPETKKIDDLLYEMRQRRIHMAICVDEFGGTAGLVTLEDILEEIFGEISDEYDEAENEPYCVDRDGSVEVDPSMHPAELEERTSIRIGGYGEEFDTLAGYLLKEFNRIPLQGERIERDGYRFEILKMENNRITRVRVSPVKEKEDPDDN